LRCASASEVVDSRTVSSIARDSLPGTAIIESLKKPDFHADVAR